MPSLNSGIVASSFVYPTVTGGNITSDATYYYHTFLASGTLTVTGGNVVMEVYLVAAGAGGGTAGRGRTQVSTSYRYWSNGGGGGGGGTVNVLTAATLTPGNYTVELNGSQALSRILKPDTTTLIQANPGNSGQSGTGTLTTTGASGGGGNSSQIVNGVTTNRTGGTGNVAGGNGGGGAGAGGNGTSSAGGAGYALPQAGGGTTTYARGGAPGQGGSTGNLPLGNNWIFFTGTPASGAANTGDGGRGGWVTSNSGTLGSGGNGGSGRVLFRFTREQVGG